MFCDNKVTELHMNQLFIRKRKLEAQIEKIISSNESQKKRRIDRFSQVTLLTKQVRDLNACIDSGRRHLADLVGTMLQEVESLVRRGQTQQAADLVRPLRQLANLAYEEQNFPWRSIKSEMSRYRRKYEHTASKADGFILAVSRLSLMRYPSKKGGPGQQL